MEMVLWLERRGRRQSGKHCLPHFRTSPMDQDGLGLWVTSRDVTITGIFFYISFKILLLNHFSTIFKTRGKSCPGSISLLQHATLLLFFCTRKHCGKQ